MRLTSCFTIICLMQIILSNAEATKGKYTVIAPGTFHCNEKYTAAVAVHNTAQPCKIRLGITGTSYKHTQLVEVVQNEVVHVEFLFPCLHTNDYNLTAEGIDCFDNFQNTKKLIYKKINYHVRIQTDKDFYAPGDDINFRVLFLDKDLRPARPTKDAVIWIEDGKRNRIKEIKNFETITGVYTGKFKISEFPVTGGWHLGVRNGAEFDRTVHFEVDRYILPNFIVKVKATKTVSVKDGDMQVIVRANYNYGKPLDGRVNVVLFLEADDFSENMKPPILGKTTKMIDGKAKLNINIMGYDAYLPYRSSPFYMTVVATVEEKLTGVKINGTASTTIYPYRYFINCINYDAFATFKVDKRKDILFQITHVDGSYLDHTKSTVELTCKEVLRKINSWHGESMWDDDDFVTALLFQNRTVSFKGHMNETGFVNFKFPLADLSQYQGYLHYYSLQLKYLDEQHEVCGTHLYWDLKQFSSPEIEEEERKEYFVLEYKYWFTDKLHLKKASQFTLNSSKPLSYFHYNVIGRGNILESGHIELPDKPKVYNLTLTPQFSWAPSFCVYVNYVDENGEYHYAEQPYEVVLELENEINVTATKRVKPGEEVTFKIQTAPNSFVGLMAADQMPFMLKPNYDFNFYEVNRVLGSYSSYKPPQGGYSTYPGEISGCVTFTNAIYFSTWTGLKKIKRDYFLEANTTMRSTAVGASEATNLKDHKGISQIWFFADIVNTKAAEFIWTIKIPETITSWVLTAFSLNPQVGFAVTRELTKITTFLPFFISIRLPYSVKRGEVINVPLWVSNYLNKALEIVVTLHNSADEYEFIEFDNEVVNEQKLSKSIRVPTNGAAGVSFLLKPKALGKVMLNFTASTPIAGDVIHKYMKVVPEGITQYANRAYFVNLGKEGEFKSSFALKLPQDVVPGSEKVEVGVMSDILGPILKNVDTFLLLPTGCAEQTMSNLLSTYLIMKYLNDSKRLTGNIKTKLGYYLETGFQNILYYRHRDGSFSSFGPTQIIGKLHTGFTLLTANVVRSLQQIKQFIYVDDKIIEEGLDYLSKQQAANGSFIEKGDYFYASQRNHVTLTCSAVLAIMENSTFAEKYSEKLNKGLDFIAQYIGKSDCLHAQAIGTFTLNKAKHATAKYEVYKFLDLAKAEPDRLWWSAEKQHGGFYKSDVEITSYALLTLLDQESTKVVDVLPIINWLITQRNSYGGIVFTQDTVVGLTALIEFAKFSKSEAVEMTVDIKSREKKETVNFTEDSGIMYQNIKMPPDTKSINITAKGAGFALVQIAYQYNLFERNPNTSFSIKIGKMYNIYSPLRLHMIVCVYYVGEGDSSNMALLEISTPSGYVIDYESLKETNELKRVSRTELKHSDTLLVVYFDHLYKNNETCLLIEAIRTHSVAMQKPASIVLYDYYDASKGATAFYEVESKLCDICETEKECSKCM